MRTLAFLLALLLPVVALGQDRPDPFSTARLRFGPFALSPTIGITNFGIDTNIFNETVDRKRDFTATLSPQAQLWLRLGRGRLSTNTRLDYVYFSHYANERAANIYSDTRIEAPFNRITLYGVGSFVAARERPGYEIDARARRIEKGVTLGTDLRVGAKTTVGFAAWRTKIDFDADQFFLGSYLNEVLNRRWDGLRASLRYRLTPLTTIIAAAEAQRDRFELSSVRDSDSVRIVSGVDLDRFALISGSARIGYRKYNALNPGLPSFRGLIATADLGYTFLLATRFSVHTERDIQYSFEIEEPYYLQTGATLTVTQKVTSKWDAQGTMGRYNLAYRNLDTLSGRGRTDNVLTFGVGAGYGIGPTTRLGVNLDHYSRTSDISTREYNGLRLSTSVTYGF